MDLIVNLRALNVKDSIQSNCLQMMNSQH